MPEETQVRLIATDRMCEGTAAFSFSRPDGYAFTAGQYLRLTVTTPSGQLRHSFSHADAPGDETTVVLTRLTGSPYKQALLAMRPGDTATMSGPYGTLVLAPEVRRAGFLVGGVGVSPARGILRDVIATQRDVELLIFNGNMDESCVPFRQEFDAVERDHAGIRFVHVLAEPPAGWTGERGFITPDIVRRHCDPLDGMQWYVCGPPAMVDAMRRVVDELAIPADRLHFELFAGYE